MIIWCTAFIYTHYKKNRHYTLLSSNYKQVPFVHVHDKWHIPVIGVYSGMQVYGQKTWFSMLKSILSLVQLLLWQMKDQELSTPLKQFCCLDQFRCTCIEILFVLTETDTWIRGSFGSYWATFSVMAPSLTNWQRSRRRSCSLFWIKIRSVGKDGGHKRSRRERKVICRWIFHVKERD